MNAREAAQLYVSRGWYPIPLRSCHIGCGREVDDHETSIPHGTKECRDEDWLERVYVPEEFEPDDNVGIRLVGAGDKTRFVKLAGVDLDCSEVVDCAWQFLPKTGAAWGRASKKVSQALYRTPIERPFVFKDLCTTDKQRATLLELRIDHQSMAPPSLHPHGERLTWLDENPEAAVVATEELLRAVRLLATAGMTSRYYAAPGSRHEWTLALIGTFRQLGLSEDEARRVLTAAAQFNGDGKLTDRISEVRTTYARSDDDPLMGVKKIAELSGQGFVTTLKKTWGNEAFNVPQGQIERLNERHALIFQQSGDVIVITEDVEDGRPLLRFSRPEVMKLLYPTLVTVNTTTRNTPVTKALGQVWLTHPQRRFYQGIELAPNGKANAGYYNTWRGFAVEPKKGSWKLFREHLAVVCGDVPDYERYVLAWMAETVQHPDRPIGICLAFRGGQGTGKSTFAKWFGSLFGVHFLHLDSEQRLLGHFNAHLHNAIVVFADEAVWAGGKAGLGALKRMITEETLAIERKGIDTMTVRNMIHMLVASNEDWFVPKGIDDRRFAVFGVSTRRQNDVKFFGAVERELFREGGMAALLYDLLEHHDAGVNLKAIPETSEGHDQKQRSMSPAHEWWFEVLQDGDLWKAENKGDEGYRFDRDGLYESYVAVLSKAHQWTDHGTRVALGRFLRQVLPEGYPKTYQQKATGRRFWSLPDLATCRKHYETLYRGVEWAKTHAIEGEELPDL